MLAPPTLTARPAKPPPAIVASRCAAVMVRSVVQSPVDGSKASRISLRAYDDTVACTEIGHKRRGLRCRHRSVDYDNLRDRPRQEKRVQVEVHTDDQIRKRQGACVARRYVRIGRVIND